MLSPSFRKTLENTVEAACRAETNVFGYGIWTHHIVYVVKYGMLLAEMMDADAEIVEVAALLHDYAAIKDSALAKEHHIYSPIEAERLLRSLDYPELKIDAVKLCIASHRASVDIERESKEAICLANADAMAHIDQVPSLLYLTYACWHMSIDEGKTWVKEKLERSWNKLTAEAKEATQEKYDAALKILGALPGAKNL